MDTRAITYAGNSGVVEVSMEGAMRLVVEFIRALLRDNSASASEADFELARRIIEQGASAASPHWLVANLAVKPEAQEAQAIMAQRQKNQAAIRLLQEWLADESGYDEQNWPRIKQAIEENRLSDRKRFDD